MPHAHCRVTTSLTYLRSRSSRLNRPIVHHPVDLYLVFGASIL